MTELEKKYLKERVFSFLSDKGINENDFVLDRVSSKNLESGRLAVSEVEDFVEAFGEDMVNDIENIDNTIREFFLEYEAINLFKDPKALFKDSEKQEEAISRGENLVKNIEQQKDKVKDFGERIAEKIDEKELPLEKRISYKKLISELVNRNLDFLDSFKRKVKERLFHLKDIFKETFLERDSLDLKLNKEEQLNLAKFSLAPASMLVALSKSEEPKVLRQLALNPNINEEVVQNLMKSNDMKTKELLLENPNLSQESVMLMFYGNKDRELEKQILGHKNLPREVAINEISYFTFRASTKENATILASKSKDPVVLEEVYKSFSKNDEVVKNLVKNKETPEDLLLKVNKEATSSEIKGLIKSHQNFPKIEKFEEPEVGDTRRLYSYLLFNTSIRRQELINMFAEKNIYADKDGNCIIPVIDDDKIVGGYKIDLNKKEIEPLENGIKDGQALALANKIGEDLFFKVEEIEESIDIEF